MPLGNTHSDQSVSLITTLNTQGFVIVDTLLSSTGLSDIFQKKYRSKFTSDPERNRNLVKAFANDINVRKAFFVDELQGFLNSFMSYPVMTGPVVTHWTSTDSMGGGFGLPYHQDWPSMGTSGASVICWMALDDVTADTHGIKVIPGSHLHGPMKGKQTSEGYIIETDERMSDCAVYVRAGQVLIMSAWLAHKTYINPCCSANDFKLSLSLRFDDLEDELWNNRDFVCAYRNLVDRDVWIKS